jgi:hypothetical protein
MNLFAAFLFLMLPVSMPVHAVKPVDQKRLDEVAERGTHVMPFDLEKTVHVFSKTPEGGIQQIVVRDKSDSEQIQLIRAHLSKISAEFSQGDYSRPMHIHGQDMPGLDALKTASPGQVEIEYLELSDGAQIHYASQSPQLIDAIHQWFEAQLSDHARHAVSAHPHEHGQYRHSHDKHHK